ncbi:MAG: DUF72 domain-containing protein [Bacteroidota bacterium]
MLKGVHPSVRFGTTSDRYAGWIGQVYPESYRERTSSRRRRLGGASYVEETVPVDSVAHYFDHFDVLEVDYTFYAPLLNEGAPSRTLHTLRRYADHLPDGALVFVKAPQVFSAPALGRGASRDENPRYLDAVGYERDFLAPLERTLGPHLGGVIFEQEYRRAAEAPSPEAFVDELAPFVAALPAGTPHHLEIRTPSLLSPVVHSFLREEGIGAVFSHWTWLPPLREQVASTGARFSSSDGNVVVRLLTPLRTRYADAYAATHPFDAPVPELVASRGTRRMIEDAARIAALAAEAGAVVNVFSNNRAYGNAPSLAAEVARAALEVL